MNSALLLAASIALVIAAAPDAGASGAGLGASSVAATVSTSPLAPVVVQGYPHELRNGTNDVADHVGWSKDGSLFGYCAELGGQDPMFATCRMMRADGSIEERTTQEGPAGQDHWSAAKKHALDAFVRDSAIPRAWAPGASFLHAMPPPLVARWHYPDVRLDVVRVAASTSERTSGGTVATASAFVEVGGSVDGEPAVHPIALVAPQAATLPASFAVLNGLAFSADGREVGMVGHFFAGEYTDDFVIRRLRVDDLAAQIYNATGMRHHREQDFARAAALFTRASLADPGAKLPAYNLACAFARLGDARAEPALREAIRRGGDEVRVRARGDVDFAALRAPGAPAWFVALVGPR